MAKSSVLKKTVQAGPTPEMLASAQKFYLANRECNKAKRDADTERKSLFSRMIQSAITKFQHTFTHEDRVVTIDVYTGCKEATYLDNETLFKELGLVGFMKVAGVSKQDLKKEFPDRYNKLVALAERECLRDENVHVEEHKG